MTANFIFLALSMLLEFALVTAVMARRQGRVAGRFPFFTALIGFEALRTLFGITLAGHLDAPVDHLAGTVFASLRIGLLLAVAWELFFAVARLRRPKKRRSVGRAILFAAVITLSAVAALGLPLLAAPGVRGSIDRGELFTALLMLGVFASCHNRLHRSESGRMMQGFAVLSVATLTTQLAMTTPAGSIEMNSGGAWFYVVPAAIVLVLAFWLWRFAVPLKQVTGPAIDRTQVLAT
jgi:hypothetical protein